MLIERVRRALEPDYEILEEIAGGGMGLVFAARQRRLDRKVAIKILRPEQATAIGAERFLTEGRVLARLAHPNIVPIYDAGEADGLLYYVMEYVEGETLADRLLRGPLSAQEALAAIRDLLSALGAAHARGIVHRDVKPANIFLRDGRALLGDFGIARWREQQIEGFTTPGEVIGTPRYMSPEQRDGLPATTRTDVYAAGLVVYEACSGARWPNYQQPKAADWTSLPPALALPVRRALELAPEDRWADASEFAGALGEPVRRRRWILPVAAVLLAGLGIRLLWPPPPPQPTHGLVLEIGRFSGGNGLGDSTAASVRNVLSGMPDFYVPPAGTPSEPGAIQLEGSVTIVGDSLRVIVQESGAGRKDGNPIAATANGTRGAWQSVADAVASDLVYKVWMRAAKDPDLPIDAIPASPADRARLAKAEQLFSLGRWEEAQLAYQSIDNTMCLLCALRSVDIARWFGLPRPVEQLALLQRNESRFPPQYRSLIRAYNLPARARLDTLEGAYKRWPGFFLASFEYGDEMLHRGPLFGQHRSAALLPLYNAVLNRPRFEPGLEHLAWLLVSEGDSAAAKLALDSLLRRPVVSGLSGMLPVLRNLGFHWRFLSIDSARHFSSELLRQPSVIGYPDSRAGARLLMSMDAPRGAVELGEMLTKWADRSDAVVEGLLGELNGYAALGRPDAMRVIHKRLARSSTDPSYALLALELEAALRAFDPDSSRHGDGDLRNALALASHQLAAEPKLRRRATWALGLLAARSGDSTGLARARRELGDPARDPLARVLEAQVLSRTDPRRATELLQRIPSLDEEVEYPDPLMDAVGHLLLAEMQERAGQYPQALRTLLWHEHSQIQGHLTGEPQAGEMAWALGTLVRWRRARLLDQLDREGSERCRMYAAVARLWAEGQPPYRARADSANLVLKEPGLPVLNVITCRVLGPVSLDVDGAPAPAELLWRKHLALLVYLARSPKRARSREHLTGLLWPEKEEGAARHSLNEALRLLRRTAGDAAVDASAGQVRLAGHVVRLDADDLEHWIAERAWREACGIIAGEFLEGFSVPGAEAFEEWLAAERRHWKQRSLDALLGFAAALLTEGHTAEALAASRRAEALDSHSDLAARAVMTALAVQGHGAAACAHFERFTAGLARDVGSTPAAATQTLAERIRAARGPRPPSLPVEASARRRAPLVGRGHELGQLLAFWEHCRSGIGATAIVLQGDAGSGKTRLLEELASRVRLGGGTVVLLRAVEADLAEPGSGLLGLARGGLLGAPGLPAAAPEALAVLAALLPDWADHFGAAVRAPAGQLSLSQAMLAIIEAALEGGPLWLVVDDAQWIDRISLLALLAALRSFSRSPLGLLLAAIPDPPREELEELRRRLGHEVPGVMLALGPLDAAALKELAAWALPQYDAVALERVCRRVASDSAGLPILAVELLSAVAQGLDLQQGAAAWPEPFHTLTQSVPGDLPDTVIAAVRIGFRRLSREAQQALCAAAVLGDRVTEPLLVRATGLDTPAIQLALDELEWQRWLEADGRGYGFVAQLARQVVARDMLTPGQRARILERSGTTPAA